MKIPFSICFFLISWLSLAEEKISEKLKSIEEVIEDIDSLLDSIDGPVDENKSKKTGPKKKNFGSDNNNSFIFKEKTSPSYNENLLDNFSGKTDYLEKNLQNEKIKKNKQHESIDKLIKNIDASLTKQELTDRNRFKIYDINTEIPSGRELDLNRTLEKFKGKLRQKKKDNSSLIQDVLIYKDDLEQVDLLHSLVNQSGDYVYGTSRLAERISHEYILEDSILNEWEISYFDFLKKSTKMEPHKIKKNILLLPKLNHFENHALQAEDMSISMITNALPKNACLVSFSEKGSAETLTWEGKYHFKSFEFPKLFEATYDSFYKRISEYGKDKSKKNEQEVLYSLARMYEQIMTPVLRTLPENTDTLILDLPDSIFGEKKFSLAYAQIPFCGLLDQNPIFSDSQLEIIRLIAYCLCSLFFIFYLFGQVQQKSQMCKKGNLMPNLYGLLAGGLSVFFIWLGSLQGNTPTSEYAMGVIGLSYFFISILLIIFDLHWVFTQQSKSKKRTLLKYLLLLIIPLLAFFALGFLAECYSSKEFFGFFGQELPIYLFATLTVFIFLLWRLLVRLLRKRLNKKEIIWTAAAFMYLPLVTWIAMDQNAMSKITRVFSLSDGEFLSEKYDLLYIQTPRDLLDKKKDWSRPQSARTVYNRAEMRESLDKVFRKNKIKHFSQSLESASKGEGIRYLGFTKETYPPLTSFFGRGNNLFDYIQLQNSWFLPFQEIEQNQGNSRTGNWDGFWKDQNGWLLFAGYNLRETFFQSAPDQLTSRFISQKFQNFAYSIWPPSLTKGMDAGFLGDFYQKALLTGNAPRALAKVQRERIRNAENKVDAILSYGGYRLTFRGPLPE